MRSMHVMVARRSSLRDSVPIVRTFAPFVAGVGRMTYGRFLAFGVAGALLWVGLLVSCGYLFGTIPAVRENFALVMLAIVAVSIAPLAVEYARGAAAPLSAHPTSRLRRADGICGARSLQEKLVRQRVFNEVTANSRRPNRLVTMYVHRRTEGAAAHAQTDGATAPFASQMKGLSAMWGNAEGPLRPISPRIMSGFTLPKADVAAKLRPIQRLQQACRVDHSMHALHVRERDRDLRRKMLAECALESDALEVDTSCIASLPTPCSKRQACSPASFRSS